MNQEANFKQSYLKKKKKMPPSVSEIIPSLQVLRRAHVACIKRVEENYSDFT